MSTLISLGALPVTIAELNLGPVISTQISISPEMVPKHDENIGSAAIAPSSMLLKKFNGALNVSTEDIVVAIQLIDILVEPIKGSKVEIGNFDCQLLKGSVYLIPQFSISTSIDGWSSIGFNLPLKSLEAGSSLTSSMIVCGLPIVKPVTAGTISTDNLCPSMSCNGIGISSISVSCNCGYELIYTDTSSDSIDCVLNTFNTIIDFGIYDCENISNLQGDVSVQFSLINGLKTLEFKNCTSMISGVTNNNGINTWNVKTYGVLA